MKTPWVLIFSLSTQRILRSGWRMPRLIRVFAGSTSICWFCHEAAQATKWTEGRGEYCVRSRYGMLCFCEMYFVFVFLCELSHQQRNNISGIAARYKIFGVNAHKEIIRFYIFFLLIQIQNTCRFRRIRISDWSVHGDTKHARQCFPWMHLVVQSHVMHITVYQKWKQNLSKMLVLNILFYACCFVRRFNL